MIKVAVIGGGTNGEHEVSLKSAAAAAGALNRERFEVHPITQLRDGSWESGGQPATFADIVSALSSSDVVLPLIHGVGGEDGTLAALCELVGVLYVGCNVTASAIGMDKHATKLLAESIGIRTAGGALLTRDTAAAYRWTQPVVVKPVDAGSSVGVSWVTSPEQLPAALADAFEWSKRVLVEELIEGREIDITVFEEAGELVISAPLEISDGGRWDYEAKYHSPKSVTELFTIPAALAPSTETELQDQAARMYRALNASGVVRFDFFLDERGWLLNEVNTIPGMTATSQVPLVYAEIGLKYPELLERLIGQALSTLNRPGFHALREF